MDDYMKMMEEAQKQALEMQQKLAEEHRAKVLEQHRRMSEELGVEPDEAELEAQLNEQLAGQAAMQQQAMEMQRQFMEGYQQMDPEQMQAMMAQQAALMGQMVGDEDDEDEISEEELAAFIAQNSPPAEYAKYLPIGALLIGTHGEPYETLVLIQDKEYTEMVLEEGWGIEDREEGLEMLESLLGGRHATLFKDNHMALKAGNTDEVSEEDAEDYEASVEAILEVLELPKSLVDGCETLLAWDLERVGYLARLFVNTGYLTPEEAWGWIAKAAAVIKSTFSSWEEYMVSLLLGRGFAMGVHQEPYAIALDLLTDSKSFLDEHPISAL